MAHCTDDFFCRVCGYRESHPIWGSDGHSPKFDSCDCCGVEHGYQDSTPNSAKVFRDRWIANGAHWMTKAKKPDVWNLNEQLSRVPRKFRFSIVK